MLIIFRKSIPTTQILENVTILVRTLKLILDMSLQFVLNISEDDVVLRAFGHSF